MGARWGRGKWSRSSRKRAAAHGKDVSWIGKLRLTPFVYYAQNRAIVAADFLGVLPLRTGERIRVALRPVGRAPVAVQERDAAPPSASEDFVFDLSNLVPATYEVAVSVGAVDPARVQAAVRFPVPAAPPAPPDPRKHLVGSLPAAPRPPAYDLTVQKGGGFAVRLGAARYVIDSAHSYPYGGENRLTAGDRPNAAGEKTWQVSVEKTGPRAYRVVAGGSHYRLTRRITAQATRVLVQDEIRNLTDTDLGLALDNRLAATDEAQVEVQAPGAPAPPLFLQAANHGVGLAPLNDLYQMLQQTYLESRAGGARIAGLGIPKGGSHTLEWAVYPIATTDYYDLINAIRQDEGLTGRLVDGCLSITHSGRWLRELPPDELVRRGGLRYATAGCITHVADDPGISFEGIEVVRYPQEREALAAELRGDEGALPGTQGGASMSPTTSTPRTSRTQIFPGSGCHRALGQAGDVRKLRGLLQRGAPRAGLGLVPLLPDADQQLRQGAARAAWTVMMDGIGADSGVGGRPAGRVRAGNGRLPDRLRAHLRRPGTGTLCELDPAHEDDLAQAGVTWPGSGREALIAYIRRINAKGGRVWINHMSAVPRSFAREEAYWAAETNDGDHRCAATAPGARAARPGQPRTSTAPRRWSTTTSAPSSPGASCTPTTGGAGPRSSPTA